MRYVCLVHFDPAILDAMPPEERRDVDRRTMNDDDALRASGHLVHAEAIQGDASAVLVRVRGGQVSTTDGPYIESKEQLGGLLILEARDMNEAVAIATRDYFAGIGTIEVRPVYEFADPR